MRELLTREHGIQGRIVSVAAIAPADARSMYEIFARHYDCVSPAQFLLDLSEKDCVLVLRSATGTICGFSTQKVFRVSVGGRAVRAVFSGDTIVDRAYWGEQELGRCWCRYVNSVFWEEPEVPLYWFLISKGYRTYLYLPLFFESFYPNCEAATPAFEQRLLDTLAAAKFPDYYRPESGLIEFPLSLGQLKPHLAEIPARRLRDPRVQFFLKRNPAYANGHELACLAEISPLNMKLFAGRILGRAPAAEALHQGAD
jgi:hypothetical protein